MSSSLLRQARITPLLALAALLATGFALPLGKAQAAEETLPLSTIIGRVQKVYQETHDLTANFQQSYFFKVTGRSKKSSGRVFIKLPGKMRWDYLEPEEKHFVADGKMLWVIAPQDRQVMRQTMAQSDIASVLGFLMGSGDLRTQFDMELLGRDGAAHYRLKLVPRGNETHYRQVVLVLDPTTFRTVETEVTDPAGNLNHLVFSNIQANQGLPDSGFSLEIPPGFRVIEGSAPSSRSDDAGASTSPRAPTATPDAPSPSR